jgi:TolB-like protein/DNA-binding winged helix-turn-helix (wHTH) protein
MNQEKQVYEFGPFRIDSVERLLFRGQDVLPLTPKAIDTLLALISNPGRVLEKEELMKMVWQDSFVEEGGLARNVSLLRKTIGDTEEDRYIETIPKRGYRFVATVRNGEIKAEVEQEIPRVPAPWVPVEQVRPKRRPWVAVLVISALAAVAAIFWYQSHARRVELAPTASSPVNALAVLPFRNVTGDPAQDYFADGMTQALITSLAKLGSLRVISLASAAGGRAESQALEAIVRDRSASLVLRGTVLRSGERVRIDAQLLEPNKGAVYWANYYERDVKDLLSLESAVAQAIATEIQVGITAKEREQLSTHRQVKPQALDSYMRGRHLWNRRTEESLRQAAQHFQQAVAADPEYALAYSGLADSYSLLGSIGVDGMAPSKAMPLAKAAALRALELDPGLAEAYVSLAYVKF